MCLMVALVLCLEAVLYVLVMVAYVFGSLSVVCFCGLLVAVL